MVIRPIAALTLMIIVTAAHAATLDAEVDRQDVEMGDILTFTITLSGVDIGQHPEPPDFSALEKDFRIIARQRNTQLMMHNGQMAKFEQWQLQVTPRRTGRLTLPALSIGSAHSRPIFVQVRPRPRQLQDRPAFFLTNQIDTDSAYVNQQVRYQVRLYYRGQMINGAVAPPAAQDAQILRLGEEKVFRKQVDDLLYTVIEWHYALFPQRPGTLTLRPQGFTGQLYLDQKLHQLSGKTRPVTLHVKPVPAAWPPGHSWLPSHQVSLKARWNRPDTPRAGDSLTLTLTLTAQGVRGEQLPKLTLPTIDGVRVYAEPAKTDTRRTPDGVEGVKTYRWTLLLTRNGLIEIPSLRLPWWNLKRDSLEWVATDALKINVAPAAADTPAPVVRPQATASTQTQNPALWPWQLATAVLALLSLILLWRLRRRDPAQPARRAEESAGSRPARKKDGALCRMTPARLHHHLIRNRHLLDAQTKAELARLEAALYRDEDPGQAERLRDALCRKIQPSQSSELDAPQTGQLKSIYPSG